MCAKVQHDNVPFHTAKAVRDNISSHFNEKKSS